MSIILLAAEQAPRTLQEPVTVECALADQMGRVLDLRVKSTFEYRWGYMRIHKELLVPTGGIRGREFERIVKPMPEQGGRIQVRLDKAVRELQVIRLDTIARSTKVNQCISTPPLTSTVAPVM
jgi:hypothetical protein